MLIHLITIISCWLLLFGSPAEARMATPEGPSGTAHCSDRQDNDVDGAGEVRIAAVPPRPARQIGATGVYAAEAEAGVLAGTLGAVVGDPLIPFGAGQNYIHVPLPEQNPFAGKLLLTGAPVGTYEVFLLARVR